MNMEQMNWLAILAAGVLAFVIGGIWYSPLLFGKAWMRENNFTEEQLKQSNKGRIFGWAILLTLLMAANLGMFLADGPRDCPENCVQKVTVGWGAMAGFLSGIWTFCAIAIHSLFEMKSWRLILINGGYSLVTLVVMGSIIGLWR
jgi:Protein of unknown function (DUF1761)